MYVYTHIHTHTYTHIHTHTHTCIHTHTSTQLCVCTDASAWCQVCVSKMPAFSSLDITLAILDYVSGPMSGGSEPHYCSHDDHSS